jgi:hypothetical protein
MLALFSLYRKGQLMTTQTLSARFAAAGDRLLSLVVPTAGACYEGNGQTCQCGPPNCVSRDQNGNMVWTYRAWSVLQCDGSCQFIRCVESC